MKCKYCLAELEEEVRLCPFCGKDLTQAEEEQPAEMIEETTEVDSEEAEEQACEVIPTDEYGECSEVIPEAPAVTKKKNRVLKLVLALLGCAVLMAVLVGAILYGLGFNLKSGLSGVLLKTTYTVTDEKASQMSDVVIATVGDRELTNGELQVYYWSSVQEFINYYDANYSSGGLTSVKNLDEQIFDSETGMTFQQMFLESALETWHRHSAMVHMAHEAGLKLDENTQNYIDSLEEQLEAATESSGHESADEYLSAMIGSGCTVEGYKNYLYAYYMGRIYSDLLMETEFPSDEEIEAYFAEHEAEFNANGVTKDSGNYYDVRHILVELKGDASEESSSEAQWTACQEEAQKLLDEYLAGEATEEIFAKMAVEHSADGGSSANGGLYTELTADTNFVESFKEWYLDESRKPGDTGLVKSSYGYHIMYFSGSEPVWKVDATNGIIADNVAQLMEEAKAARPMNVKYASIVLGNVA